MSCRPPPGQPAGVPRPGRDGRPVTVDLSRRRLLLSVGLLAAAGAGCSADPRQVGRATTAGPASSARTVPTARSLPSAPPPPDVDDSAVAPTTPGTATTAPAPSSARTGPAIEIGRGRGT